MTTNAETLGSKIPPVAAAERIGAACRAVEAGLPLAPSEGDPLGLDLGDGNTFADNMGCGVVVVDQVDWDTQKLQRVVLTKEDLEKLLTWIG